MTPVDILLLMTNVCVTSLGVVLLKAGATSTKFRRKYTYIFSGFSIYFMMSLITIYLYSRYQLVFVQTLLSLTYVLSPVFAALILKEKLNKGIVFGLVLLVFGIFLVSISY